MGLKKILCYGLASVYVAVMAVIVYIIALIIVVFTVLAYPCKILCNTGPDFTLKEVVKDAAHIPEDSVKLWEEMTKKC